jgi:hypothetical protein
MSVLIIFHSGRTGWNQDGGPELFTIGNQESKGLPADSLSKPVFYKIERIQYQASSGESLTFFV